MGSMPEQEMSFRVGDSWCRASTLELRSGIKLVTTSAQLERSFTFAGAQPASEIELSISRGSVIHTTTADGHELPRAGNALQIGRMRHDVPLTIRSGGELLTECVSLSTSTSRLRELLGTSELEGALSAITRSGDPYPLVSEAMTPALLRLLDEITNARGKARPLWLEAKGLELLAVIADELAEIDRAAKPTLDTHEVERIERVRGLLIHRLDEPPTLTELARSAGISETKLKGEFRTRFGTSVFAYLRRARMERAQSLLEERRFNVSEVAMRVGYANPSKFAAAFRRELGMSPSDIVPRTHR
jgi:AraC-like DNA-binding protein